MGEAPRPARAGSGCGWAEPDGGDRRPEQDQVALVLPVYPAREAPIPGVDAALVVAAARAAGHPAASEAPPLDQAVVAIADAFKDKDTKVVIGGAPVTQAYAEQIGADGYSAVAPGAVKLVKELVG